MKFRQQNAKKLIDTVKCYFYQYDHYYNHFSVIVIMENSIRIRIHFYSSFSQHYLQEVVRMAAGSCNHFQCPLRGDIDIPLATCLKTQIITIIFSHYWATSRMFMCVLLPCKEMNKIQKRNCSCHAAMKSWLAFKNDQ